MTKQTGFFLIFAGLFLLLSGLLIVLTGKFPFLGKLPGDIHIQGKHTTFTFPIVTCLLLSILLTVILNIVVRVINR